MKSLVLALLLSAICFAATPANAGTVTLVEAVKLADFRWKYVIDFDSSQISGDVAEPFFMSDVTNWQHLPMTMVGTNLRVEVVTYNKEGRVAVAGNELTGAWFDGHSSGYWDEVQNEMVFGFFNGALYVKGSMPINSFPAETIGDEFFRYKIGSASISVYVNLAHQVGGLFDSPFVMTNIKGWAPLGLTIVNSYGWATADLIRLSLPCQLELAAGGHLDGDPQKNNWIDFSRSIYYQNGQIVVDIGGPKLESIRLISSVQLPDKRWKYTLAISRNFIYGSNSLPKIMGDFNRWQRLDMNVDDNGWLIAEIMMYNQVSRLSIAGNELENSWFDGTNSIYWSAEQNSVVIGFFDGQIFLRGQISIDTRPIGTLGDDYLRYKIDGDSLVVFINLLKQLSGLTDKPFVMSSLNNWQVMPAVAVDANGWAEFILPGLVTPMQVQIVGGGHADLDPAKINWIDFSGSVFWDSVRQFELLTIDQGVYFVGMNTLANGQIEYSFGFNTAYLPGTDRSMPTFAVSCNGWQPLDLVDLGYGLYLAKFTTDQREFKLAVKGTRFTVDSGQYLIDSANGRITCRNPQYVKSPYGQSDDYLEWLIQKYEVMMSDIYVSPAGVPLIQIVLPQTWSSSGAVTIKSFGLICK